MNTFQFQTRNRLPKGLQAEALINTDQVITALLEQGLEEQAKPFLPDLRADTKREPFETWIRWKAILLHDKTVTFCVVGAPYFQGQIHVRGLVVQNVPESQRTAAELGFAEMITDYLEELRMPIELQDETGCPLFNRELYFPLRNNSYALRPGLGRASKFCATKCSRFRLLWHHLPTRRHRHG